MNEEDDDQPQASNQFRNNQATNDRRTRWGPRGPSMNRQSSQDERQFVPRGMGGGPRGPRPTGPRGPPPPREDHYARDPHRGNDRALREENRDWDRSQNASWNYSRDDQRPPPPRIDGPPAGPGAQQKSDVGVDPSKVNGTLLKNVMTV